MEFRKKLAAYALYGALAGLTVKLLFWRGLLVDRLVGVRNGEYAVAAEAFLEIATLMAICAFVGAGVGLIRNLYAD
jgi:hypothetical protein